MGFDAVVEDCWAMDLAAAAVAVVAEMEQVGLYHWYHD